MSSDEDVQRRDHEEALAYRVFQLVRENARREKKHRKTMAQLAAQVSAELNVHVSRQQMYDQIDRALAFGFAELTPPLGQRLHDEITNEFQLTRGTVRVVNAQADWNVAPNLAWAGEEVARMGARRVLTLAQDMWSKMPATARRPISIGLGPGRATAEWARYFSDLLRHEAAPPELVLVAITSGGDPYHPEFAPSNFFGFFPRDTVRCIGLFGPTLIRQDELKALKTDPERMPGFAEAYAQRGSIDIVVSSMGDPHDEHDLLTRYLHSAKLPIPPGVKGNVQYRYYSDTAPTKERGSELRALTIFELEDFHTMASTPDKHVVLLARTCALCKLTRADALRPLLKQPALKVWTEIVMDVPTARKLVRSA